MSMARDGIRQRADRVTRLDFSRQGFIRKPNQHRIIHSPLHILCTFTSAHRIRTMGWKDTDSRQKPLLDNRMPRARRPHTTCRTPSSVRCECHKPTSEADEVSLPKLALHNLKLVTEFIYNCFKFILYYFTHICLSLLIYITDNLFLHYQV